MKYLTACFFLLTPFLSLSQLPEWKYLSTGQYINGIEEDSNFIWIVNYAGITKFDPVTQGKTYYNTTNSPLETIQMKALTIDAQHNKWFTTYSMGWLYRLDAAGWTVFDTSNCPLSTSGVGSV